MTRRGLVRANPLASLVGALSGAGVGAIAGAFAGPEGALAGTLTGWFIGLLAGAGLGQSRLDLLDRERWLDERLGPTPTDLSSIPPPPKAAPAPWAPAPGFETYFPAVPPVPEPVVQPEAVAEGAWPFPLVPGRRTRF